MDGKNAHSSRRCRWFTWSAGSLTEAPASHPHNAGVRGVVALSVHVESPGMLIRSPGERCAILCGATQSMGEQICGPHQIITAVQHFPGKQRSTPGVQRQAIASSLHWSRGASTGSSRRSFASVLALSANRRSFVSLPVTHLSFPVFEGLLGGSCLWGVLCCQYPAVQIPSWA